MRAGVTKQELISSLEQTIKLTREGVAGLELINDDYVVITYISGGQRLVNIHLDSGMAIIRDVAKAVD